MFVLCHGHLALNSLQDLFRYPPPPQRCMLSPPQQLHDHGDRKKIYKSHNYHITLLSILFTKQTADPTVKTCKQNTGYCINTTRPEPQCHRSDCMCRAMFCPGSANDTFGKVFPLKFHALLDSDNKTIHRLSTELDSTEM